MRYQYDRMNPRQLSDALNHLGLTMSQFCKHTGYSERKMEYWLKGEEPIPATMPVMVALMLLPGGLERAIEVSNHFIIKDEQGHPVRKDKRETAMAAAFDKARR